MKDHSAESNDFNEKAIDSQKEKTAIRKFKNSNDKFDPSRLFPYGFGEVPQDFKRR